MQKITLIGNLGKDPEERFTASGKKVITFSLAVKLTKDTTVWYDCSIWEDRYPMLKAVISYLKKGSKVCLIGDLGNPGSYQNNQGEIKIKNTVNPFSISLIGGDSSVKGESINRSKISQNQSTIEQDLIDNIPF